MRMAQQLTSPMLYCINFSTTVASVMTLSTAQNNVGTVEVFTNFEHIRL